MKKRNVAKLLSCLLALTGIFLLSACGEAGDEGRKQEGSSDGKPIVAVTIVPEKTFAEAVCGDLAEVITLVPPGSSPENYEPTPQIMEKFSKAEVYFALGVPTEEANILPNAGKVKVVHLEEQVAAAYADRTFGPGERDPHTWLSPKRAKVMVAGIAEEMSRLDPANQEVYEANAQAYMDQLDQLDQEIASLLAGVKNRQFVVYHPAFGYLADDYGLQMVALEEEGKESTIQHLTEMVDLAKKENIKVIFYQEEIDSSQSAAFAQEIGGTTVKLEPLAADYIDNLKKMAETMAEVME
ncbi:zinc ABC transporter solute-binding protein [Aminipila butyrica]|uniref:Zinc ABC transporter solute-binding protein n=1 Tax=Aminipila butyrica TaxID=433296 RepID=A0A858BY11_9FIRM|nr:zinc ABC transporter substrate-binding protein [Aminipila butyrica]QIB68956.1 zinc ABC transporter solute-binding protein [Aminipila butyrica]